MISHDRTLSLAATSIDFPLSPDDRGALDDHLDACSRCRGAAGLLRHDAARLQALRPPTLESRAEVAILARLDRPRRAVSLSWSLAAVGLMLLAMLAALWAGAEIERRRELGNVDPAPRPSAQEGVVVVPTATGVAPAPSTPESSAAGSAPPEPSPTPIVWRSLRAPAISQEVEYGLSFAGAPAAFVAAGGPTVLAGGLLECGAQVEFPESATCPIGVSAYRPGSGWQTLTAGALTVHRIANTSGPQLGITSIAIGPDVAVLAGYDAEPGTSPIHAGFWWTGPDLDVQRASIEGTRDADIVAVVAWGDGFVATGVVHGDTPRAAFWTSPDGRAWTRVPDVQAFAIGGYFDTGETPSHGGPSALAVGGDAIVALGRTCDAKGDACRVVSWRSTDGTAWQRGAPGAQHRLPTALAADGQGAWLGLVQHQDANGNLEVTTAIRSSDGLVWDLADEPVLGTERAVAIGLDAGFAAVGVTASETGLGTWDATAIPDANVLEGWLPAGGTGLLPQTGPVSELWLVRIEGGVLLAVVPTNSPSSALVVLEGPLPGAP